MKTRPQSIHPEAVGENLTAHKAVKTDTSTKVRVRIHRYQN